MPHPHPSTPPLLLQTNEPGPRPAGAAHESVRDLEGPPAHTSMPASTAAASTAAASTAAAHILRYLPCECRPGHGTQLLPPGPASTLAVRFFKQEVLPACARVHAYSSACSRLPQCALDSFEPGLPVALACQPSSIPQGPAASTAMRCCHHLQLCCCRQLVLPSPQLLLQPAAAAAASIDNSWFACARRWGRRRALQTPGSRREQLEPCPALLEPCPPLPLVVAALLARRQGPG